MAARVLPDLSPLHTVLVEAGYTVVGPTVRDGAIVLDVLPSAAELPYGWGVTLQPGGYRIRRGDDAAFAHSAGPQPGRPFLHPPKGGRCIVWCPVGIDLTEEVAALDAEAGRTALDSARTGGGR